MRLILVHGTIVVAWLDLHFVSVGISRAGMLLFELLSYAVVMEILRL